jgi:hypothetical protein
MRISRVRLQFGLGALAIVVAVSTSFAWHYNSRSWPEIPWGTDRELAAATYDAFANPPSLYAVVRPGWFDKDVQQEATEAYRRWYAERQ